MRTFPFLIILFAVSISGCQKDETVSCSGDDPAITRPDNWTRATHCRGVEPDYDEVFADDAIVPFHIAISQDRYDAMMDDMDDKFSGSSSSTPDLDALPTPIWVPVTVRYKDSEWTQVGMRWKGHSSLKAAWNSGVRKLAFLLEFDHYEESFPGLENQRFYGFKKLSFSNAYNDPAIIREKVAYEIFRSADVPVPRVTFAPVYLDWGGGSAYLGVYTLIEDPADQMIKVLFEEHDGEVGNLYKPWGDVARWTDPDEADGGVSAWMDDLSDHFEKQTNGDEADWSDIADVIRTLHKERASSAQWRAELEEVFNVQGFLRALAVNQIIMNWDSYGCMHHNYYVYSDLNRGGRFVWFPWDLNEAMLYREQDGCPPPGSVMLEEIVSGDSSFDTNWPLISFLLDDEQYSADYRSHLAGVLEAAFAEDSALALIDAQHSRVSPYVIGPTEEEAYPYSNTTAEAFNESLDDEDTGLKTHVTQRRAIVENAL